MTVSIKLIDRVNLSACEWCRKMKNRTVVPFSSLEEKIKANKEFFMLDLEKTANKEY